MDYLSIFLKSLGGLGLFIYGMHVMATGLQKTAGNKMKQLLGVLTKTKLLSVLVGAGVTAIIQSSSATTVMVVGFVNAGLMNLSQSVGVIMGANVGTTVTAWLVSSVEWAKYISVNNFAPIAMAGGAAMTLFFKKDRIRQIGEVFAGIGALFLGMKMMTDGLAPLAASESFRELFISLGVNPILGILAGAVVTAIIQSSSASVGILQSLAISGLIPWNTAVYIIMGQNIGTCVTAILSSIGTTKNARSAAYIHLIFNIIGSVVFGTISIVFFTVINKEIGSSVISSTEISLVHTVFNVACTLMLFPFGDLLVKIAQKMALAGNPEPDEFEHIHLDDRVLSTPSFALQNSIKEITRLGNMSLENLQLSTQSLFSKDMGTIEKIYKREKNIDFLYDAITQYLVKINKEKVNEQENRMLTALFHTLNDIERVGDHCENIAELTEFAIAEGVEFSEVATEDLTKIINLTISCFKHSIESLSQNNKEIARIVVKEEDQIDIIEKQFRANHIKRLSNSECRATSGVIFLDVLTNLERVSDHALNISQMVLDERHVNPKA